MSFFPLTPDGAARYDGVNTGTSWNGGYPVRVELDRVMRQARMTKAALARAVGKSRPLISKIVAGDMDPKVTLAWKMADALQVELPTIFPRHPDCHAS